MFPPKSKHGLNSLGLTHTLQLKDTPFPLFSGSGDAYCDGVHIPVTAGDVIVFPPKSKHGLDNPEGGGKLYCLQLMAPNEHFVEYVQTGEPMARLSDDDLCTLANIYC